MVNKLKVLAWYKFWYAVAAALLVVIALWSPLVAPLFVKKDFNKDFALTQTEDLYDSSTGGFSGPQTFNASMRFRETLAKNHRTELTNTFRVTTDSDEQLWLSEYSYQVDPATNEFDSSYSNKSRDGYVFGRVADERDSYTYWHPKYDIPMQMDYSEDEVVHGLSTYKYRAHFEANVTQLYRDLDNYLGENDIVAKGEVQLWVEPKTGNLIKYNSTEELDFYDPVTGVETSPWKIIVNEFKPENVNSHATQTEAYISTTTLVYSLLPVVLALLFTAVFALIVSDMFRRNKNLKVDGISAGLLAAVVALCAVVLYGWQTVDILLLSSNYRIAITSPWTALIILLISAIVFLIAYIQNLGRILKTIIALAIAAFIGLAILELIGAMPLITSKASAYFLIAIGTALLLALLNSKKRLLTILFTVLIWAVIFVGISIEVSLPFRFDVPSLIEISTPSALMFALLAIAVYRSCYKNAKTNRKIMSIPMRVSVAVVGVAIIITGFFWDITKDSVNTSGARIFENDTSDIVNRIDRSIKSQAAALIGGVGLFDASDFVTRTEWQDYFQSLHPVQNVPGITCVSYGVALPTKDKALLEQSFRAEGLSAKVYPSTDSAQMVVVDYVEPYDVCKTAVGYDMYTNPTRRAAMDLARDTGMPVVSGKIKLIIEDEAVAQAGFQMYVPVYKKDAQFGTLEQRRSSLQGFVLGPTRMNEFIESALAGSATDIGIAIYDTDKKNGANEENKMYESNPGMDLEAAHFSRSVIMNIDNHKWLIKFGSLPSYTPGIAYDYSIYVLAGGLAISLLLGVVTYSLYGSRDRALKLAKTMSRNLRIERNNAIDLKREDDAILGSMGEGLILIDPECVIHRANSYILNMLGYAQDEFVGHDVSKVVILANENTKTGSFRSLISKCLHVGQGGSYSQMIMRKDGSLVPVKLSVSSVKMGGKSEGVIVIVSDMTKQYELDKAKDMFLSLATHQLKTPITAIKWYAEMLLGADESKEVLPPTKRRIALSIVKAMKHMMYIVDNLLNVSRMETGRLKAELKPVSIPAIIHRVIEDQKPLINSKKQKVICNETDNMSPALADKQYLSQIFANLINNASKYSAQNSKIEVDIKQVAKYIVVSVKDRGFGIPAHQQQEVFKKFFRGENAVRREASGSGLGLYLVKALVGVNHGSISFVSREGKGTTFTVKIPKSEK